MVGWDSDREVCCGCGGSLAGGVHYWQRTRVCGQCKQELDEGERRESAALNRQIPDRVVDAVMSLWCLLLAVAWFVCWKFC